MAISLNDERERRDIARIVAEHATRPIKNSSGRNKYIEKISRSLLDSMDLKQLQAAHLIIKNDMELIAYFESLK